MPNDTNPQTVSTSPGDRIETPFCGELRSKRFFMLDTIPTAAEQYFDPSGHCWCYHTQHALGPDGDLAGPHECKAGRTCYRSALDAGDTGDNAMA